MYNDLRLAYISLIIYIIIGYLIYICINTLNLHVYSNFYKK